MDRTEIIKALECCVKVKGFRDIEICRNCPLHDTQCAILLPQNALSLIKELTEENERLKNSITFQVVMPDEKMEEIKAECIARVELDVKECRADTVRKMHSLIKERCIAGGIYPAFVASTIEKVAKELLGE